MWKRTLPAIALILASLLTACGGAAEPTTVPTLDPELARGKRVFEIHCGACHSVTPDTTLVGPSLAGIATRADERVDGLDARAYLYTSIMRPGDFLVDGFTDVMPSTLGKSLSGEDIDAVVAYLMAQG